MQETLASSREVLTTELAGHAKAVVTRGTLLGTKRRVDGRVQGTAALAAAILAASSRPNASNGGEFTDRAPSQT